MKKKLSFPEVLMGVLIQPRQTMRQVIDNEYYSFIIPFVFVYALLAGFNPVYAAVLSKYLSFPEAVVVGFFVAFGLTFVVYFFYSWAIYWMGNKMGGKGTLPEIKAAVALAYIPMVLALVITTLLFIPTWINLITTADSLSGLSTIELINKVRNPVGSAVIAVFGIWSIVSWFICLAEAHQFSGWKVLKVLLALSVVFIVLTVVITIVAVFAAVFIGKFFH
jgi:hypothetical protein